MFLLPYLSNDTGVTDDERLHMEHGHRLLDYYEGVSTYAIQSPFDSTGQWLWMTEGVSSKTSINIYGGFFDLIASFGYKYIASPGSDEYEFRHNVSAIFGALLFIITGLIALRLTNSWRIAFLALVIAALSPRLLGHSLGNPKDIPFATFFAFSIYQIICFLQEMPDAKPKRLIMLAVSISLAMAIRAGAVILIGYLFLFAGIVGLYLLLTSEISKKKFFALAGITILTAAVGYLGTGFFWPWALQNPIINPYKALEVFRKFNMFNSLELFEGRWINNFEIPWYFVPKWFYVTFPVSVTFGFLLFAILSPLLLKAKRSSLPGYLLLIFSIAFPVLSVIKSKSNIYDDCRHVYFILPSVIVLSAAAWDMLIRKSKPFLVKSLVVIAFAWTLCEPLAFMWRNHPHEVMYFSPIIGGTKGAFKNYEMDYWGFSCRNAVEWIGKNDPNATPQNKARVRLWYGEQEKVKHYTDSSTNMVHVLANENSTDYDYFIQLAAEAKYNNDLLFHWPPKGTVYQVMVDSVPLCAVIKNYRTASFNQTAPTTTIVPTSNHTSNGLNYYNSKMFNEAIVEFKLALEADKNSAILINNIVAAYNNLTMFDDAIDWANKGLKIDPTFNLLKNNLNIALSEKKKMQYNERYFIGASYNYYKQKEFNKCVQASKEILKLNPKNTAAYNNICSAYNELREFKKAAEACDAGLALAPNEQLIKNNKKIAETGMDGK
jgi:tetratricopeptide (TPR) repeat protein